MNIDYFNKNKNLKLTLLAIFCALTVSISYLESMIPISPFLPPGVKPGFANIITMFVCGCFGFVPAIIIVIIKSIFVVITRGIIAFIMSLAGGILSTLISGLLIRYSYFNLSFIFIGIIGSLTHNLTQIIIASLIVSNCMIYYLPILILLSIITGSITGLILNIILPVLSKTHHYIK